MTVWLAPAIQRRQDHPPASLAAGLSGLSCSAGSRIGDASTPAMTAAHTPACQPSPSQQPSSSGYDQWVLTRGKKCVLVFRWRGMTDNPMPHGLHQHIAAGKRFDQSVDMPAYGFENLKVSFEIGDSSVQWHGDTVPHRQLYGGGAGSGWPEHAAKRNLEFAI